MTICSRGRREKSTRGASGNVGSHPTCAVWPWTGHLSSLSLSNQQSFLEKFQLGPEDQGSLWLGKKSILRIEK